MYCSQFCYAFSIASSKFAILGLYWRLFKLSSIRIPIQIMFVISLIWIILRTFMVIFHCVPVQAYWDKSIKNARCEINDAQFFFGTVLTHFVMDVIILVLPTIELSRLHLPLGQKLAVMGLFVIGSMYVSDSIPPPRHAQPLTTLVCASHRYSSSLSRFDTTSIQKKCHTTLP